MAQSPCHQAAVSKPPQQRVALPVFRSIRCSCRLPARSHGRQGGVVRRKCPSGVRQRPQAQGPRCAVALCWARPRGFTLARSLHDQHPKAGQWRSWWSACRRWGCRCTRRDHLGRTRVVHITPRITKVGYFAALGEVVAIHLGARVRCRRRFCPRFDTHPVSRGLKSTPNAEPFNATGGVPQRHGVSWYAQLQRVKAP